MLSPGVSGAVTGSASGFESGDGNMVLNTSGNTDWNCFAGTDGFQAGPTPAGCAVSSGATQVTADAAGELGFKNGSKFDTACPPLEIKNTPPKDDFTNIAEYSDVSASGDAFFYGGAIRSTANGNSSGNVEFNQNASPTPTTTTGCRTAGDRLLAYEFLNGGTSLDFHVLTWIDSGNSTAGGNSGTCYVKQDAMPCWGANVLTVIPAQFDGLANAAAITAANNKINGVALAINQFSEFGINLTQALGLQGQCVSFPQQVWESRSSGSSFTSNPEDVEISNHTIATCGSITIIKNAVNGNDTFSYTGTGPAGAPAGLAAFNLTTVAGTASTTFSAIPSGSYTVTEGAEPTGAGLNWQFTSLTCSASAGSTGAQVGSSTTANISLAAGGSVTCTYTNTHVVNSPTIATTLSATSGTVPVTVHDSAALTGASANAGGTVTYSVYTDNQCSVPAATPSPLSAAPGTVNVTNGSVPDSNAVTFDTAGTYYFQAVYSGDANNNPATSGCLTEILTVNKAGPTAATTQDLLPNDTFTLSGGVNPTGTVTFKLFGPSNATCTGTSGLVFSEAVTLSGTATGGTATTTNTTHHVSAAGTYRWVATYGGDVNNEAATSTCGTESFTISYT